MDVEGGGGRVRRKGGREGDRENSEGWGRWGSRGRGRHLFTRKGGERKCRDYSSYE